LDHARSHSRAEAHRQQRAVRRRVSRPRRDTRAIRQDHGDSGNPRPLVATPTRAG